MTVNMGICCTKSHLWRSLLIFAWLGVLIMISGACVAGSEVTQSFSPLPPSTTSLLSGNRWEVVEITVQGEPLQFDALKPLYFWFEPAGALNYSSPHCAGGGFLIFFENERRYKLGRGEVAAVDCGEPRQKQMGDVVDALRATTMYEPRDDQLLLTGENVRIVSKIDNSC